MKKRNTTTRLIIITLISICWVFFLPGYVAYKHGVYYGWMFKDKISKEEIGSRINNIGQNLKYISKDGSELLAYQNIEMTKITFGGFADHGLNFVWLDSYIILLALLFIIYLPSKKQYFSSRFVVLILGNYLILEIPIWIRNFTDIGKFERTVYSFVNYDIDKLSFLLQELRVTAFAILLSFFWNTYIIILEEKEKYIEQLNTSLSLDTINKLALESKATFFNWQRDMILTLLLFLPWTWFFWRNISVAGDVRFLFSGIIFHSLWVYTIIVISAPIVKLNFEFGRVQNRLLQIFIEEKSDDRTYNYVSNLQPLPRGQLIFTSIATLLSFISPWIQSYFR